MMHRIGFQSRFFGYHSVGRTTNNFIKNIDQSEFEVLVIAPESIVRDDTFLDLSRNVNATISIPDNLEEARKSIASLKLDMLIYADLGMDPMSFFMAFTRLAKKQAVMAGHPDTTGIPTIDYFISYKLLEVPNAQSHYTEELVLLDGIPSVYEDVSLPSEMKSKQELNLPNWFILLPCKLQKIHPKMDRVLRRILEYNSDVYLVLIKDPNRPWHDALDERLRHTLGEQYKQIHWHDWFFNKDEYYSTIHHSLFVLDSFPFGGGNTGYQVCGLGKPYVTLPNKYMRSRNACMLLKCLDNEANLLANLLIAEDEEKYICNAIWLLEYAPAREEISSVMRVKAHQIIGNHAVVRSFERWAKEVLEEGQ